MNNSAYVADNGESFDSNRNAVTILSSENVFSRKPTTSPNDDLNGNGTDSTVTMNGLGEKPEREKWGKGIEFLMSCIAMSVGLGNVWRFPFTALENGGGAFLFPYIVVLLLIGRPMYYLEMILGQFSSKSSIKVYNISPIFRGVGYGQFVAIFLVSTYYASIMALVARYLYDSFQWPLPWMNCRDSWLNCIDSDGKIHNGTFEGNATFLFNASSPIAYDKSGNPHTLITSSQYYFVKEVLHEADSIEFGLGAPNLNLAIFLLIAWLFITGVLIKGIQSSGKASYFLALFPYVIIFILLIRAVTLTGAWNGILYFITPRWSKILEPGVWYAAVVQVFFSLAVGFGNIVMYSSFNKFNHNVYRDATIVTTIDTFTSLLAGCTIFGILGHLAHEMGTDDVHSVVKGGPGMAFISYPDAIARFQFLPQTFSILFFFMLFILGIGSNIAMCSCIVTAIRDQFPKLKPWQTIIPVAIIGYCAGLTYTTPGGQWALTLIDYFGTSFIVFFLSIIEIVAVCWIYGVDRLCRDIEFMINRKTGVYWRLCWGLITPLLLIFILLYTFVDFHPLTYNDKPFPAWAYVIGISISILGIIQVPIFALRTVRRQRNGHTCREKFGESFLPRADWGPMNPAKFEEYLKFVNSYESQRELLPRGNVFQRIKRNMFG